MKKQILISILSSALGILLAASLSIAEGKPKEVKVQIHTIKGGAISEQQIRGWIAKANEIDANVVKFVVDSNHVYEPNTPYDPNKNDAGKVNIWGLPKCVETGEPNYVSGYKGTKIELVPGKNDSNGNVYIKDSTLAHELNELLGLEHVLNDPNNKMYPDNNDHGVPGKMHSCHRTGTNLTQEQRDKISASDVGKAQDAVISGYGDEAYDDAGDVGFGYIDLDWTQTWIEWMPNMYVLHLTTQVNSLSFETYSELGFYIESDNNPSTGLPPEGLDYYVAFQPLYHQIIFEIYDMQWRPLNPTGIAYECTYIDKDASLPPIPTGVKFELPLRLLQRRAGDVISYRAAAQNGVEMDVSPNADLLTIGIPPIPGDLNLDCKVDINDLDIMAKEWLSSGIADIYPPPPNGDNIVNFSDIAIMANNWLVECPPVCGDGYCDPREQGTGCPDCPAVCGDGYCDPREQGTGCTDCPAVCGDGYCDPREEGTGCQDCPPFCGNGICEPGEEGWCPDCPWCGNGICEPGEEGTCPEDCPTSCGNGICEWGEEGWCWGDCPPLCGNGICDPGEEAWCPDCPMCGNGMCDPGEEAWCPDCPMCGNGMCDPGEEGWCPDCPM